MPQIRKHKPGDKRLRAADWNNIADAVSGGLGQRPPPINSTMAATVLVRNDTGADLDAFDCISLGEPMWDLQPDGSADLIFVGETADADKPAAILAEPIAHDATNKRFGRAWVYGLAYATVGPAAAITDLAAAPDPANARLAPGSGNVQLLAAPSTTVETLLPVLLGATGGASASRNVLRLGFMGVDSANAYKWGTPGTDGWVSFARFISTGRNTGADTNMLAPELGISIVTLSGGGIPAAAEALLFSRVGRYRVLVDWLISTNASGQPVKSTHKIVDTSGSGGASQRTIAEGSATPSFAQQKWLQDERIIYNAGTAQTLFPQIGGSSSTADAVGFISIEQIS
jgi:hypothetical protein